MQTYEIAAIGAHLFGVIFSAAMIDKFHNSRHICRRRAKAEFIFCGVAMAIPGLNLVASLVLWLELRHAAKIDAELYIDTSRMVFPPFYRRTVVEPPASDLGEENEHA